MKQYNTRVTVQLDFNFLNSAGDSMSPDEIKAGVINMLNTVGVSGINKLQGFQQNNINFKVESMNKVVSPEDEIETDLMEYDLFD